MCDICDLDCQRVVEHHLGHTARLYPFQVRMLDEEDGEMGWLSAFEDNGVFMLFEIGPYSETVRVFDAVENIAAAICQAVQDAERVETRFGYPLSVEGVSMWEMAESAFNEPPE